MRRVIALFVLMSLLGFLGMTAFFVLMSPLGFSEVQDSGEVKPNRSIGEVKSLSPEEREPIYEGAVVPSPSPCYSGPKTALTNESSKPVCHPTPRPSGT